jgi:hypothetical protein
MLDYFFAGSAGFAASLVSAFLLLLTGCFSSFLAAAGALAAGVAEGAAGALAGSAEKAVAANIVAISVAINFMIFPLG